MVVHFICRGNAFRSFIAEAYLNSLQIKGVQVLSSGTVAGTYRKSNEEGVRKTRLLLKKYGIEMFAKPHYADQLEHGHPIRGDIVVFMNQIVRDDCDGLGKLPAKTFVWDITDIGEPGRIPKTEKERDAFREDVYHEIVLKVDQLVRDTILAS